MKTKFLFLILLSLSFFSVSAMSIQEETSDFGGYFVSVATMLTAIPLIVEYLKDKINLKGLSVQILSWSLGVILSIIGHYANLGMFEGLSLFNSLIWGVGISLISNGVADTGIVTFLVGLISKKEY